MVKGRFGFVFVLMLLMSNIAFANCAKTLMGNDCESVGKGVATHMRGDAVANAKAAKELKLAQAKAKKEASEIAAAQ